MRVPERICYGCMGELRDGEKLCPVCGWDNEKRESGVGYLPACVLKGQYFVGRALGRGGFGITYLGYDLNVNRRIAIKEYYPMTLALRTGDNTTIAAFTDARDRFEWGRKRALDEGSMTARMSRVPNTVQVYNVFEENGTAYIVMEYIDGTTLGKLVKDRGPMRWEEVYGLMRPILRALEAIHAQGVIHRDVSPDNIMMRRDSAETVLLDFGAARQYANTNREMTEMMRPGYAPPEQYDSASEQDGRTDEYAVCATMYYLLTGTVPPAADRMAYGAARLSAPRALGARVPEAVEAALLRGMSPRKEDRFATVAELREALDAAGAEGDNERTVVRMAPRSAEPARPAPVERRPQAVPRPEAAPRTQATPKVEATPKAEAAPKVEVPPKAEAPERREAPKEGERGKKRGVKVAVLVAVVLAVALGAFLGRDKLGQLFEDPWVFTNPVIEAAVREQLGRPTGDIYPAEIRRVQQLDLSDSGGFADLEGLRGMTGLQMLDLLGNEIGDIRALSDLPALRSLSLDSACVADLNQLSGLTGLTQLHLVGDDDTRMQTSYANLEALRGMTQLRELWLPDLKIDDISALGGMTQLEQLWLDSVSVSDLNQLRGLTNLTRLIVEGAYDGSGRGNYADLEALRGMTQLQNLDLSYNDIGDISALGGMTGLVSLGIDSVNVSDLNLLRGLTNLESLYLQGDSPGVGISDISALSGLTKLQELGLNINAISDISPLRGLTNLRALYLGNNENISDISALGGLTNLETLYLDDNNISDISVLGGLTNLKTLQLSYNHISDISALGELTNLQDLDLCHNDISDIRALAGPTDLRAVYLPIDEGHMNLSRLDLSDNHISDISALSGLTNLETLSLYNNNISDISALSSLTNLTTLSLPGNGISDISALAGLTNLRWLDLSYNNISDVSALAGLTGLQDLHLTGNNIQDDSPLNGLGANVYR